MDKERVANVSAGAAVVAGSLEGIICVLSMKYGNVRPVFTTWLLFFVASSLSFWTYWSSKDHSIRGNIANFMDMFICGIITLGIISFAGNDVMGRSIDIYCLITSAIILVFWRMKKRHETANILLQIVMAVAYFPTIMKLWEASRNTESLPMWVLAWFGAVFALISATVEKKKLGKLYAGCGLVLVSLILFLIVRILIR